MVQIAPETTVVHCQSELQGTVENRSLLAGGVAFDILRCWKDDHLQTSEYSLKGKYKGEVTNTTENVPSLPPAPHTITVPSLPPPHHSSLVPPHWDLVLSSSPQPPNTSFGSTAHSHRLPALHCTTLHSTALYYTTLYCTVIHYIVLHCTTLHYIALYYTTLQCIREQYSAV